VPSISPICKWVFLTDSKFQPGALVRDNHARVGKVVGDPKLVDLDGNTVEVFTVDFWGQKLKRPGNFLNLLASDSPEALLLEQPEALAPWADEAPLKLVALALSVGGGSGKAADIRAKLDGRVLGAGKWENWWKKQPQQMRMLPARFKITKVGRDSEYSLLTSFNAVPAASELKAVGGAEKEGTTPADWREWLLSPTHEPAPGRYPTKSVADSLAKWPAGTIERALFRVIVSSEGLLSAGNLSGPVAEGWLRATAQAALRWRETAGPDAVGYTAARVGGVLARLFRIAGERTPQDLLLKAGAMDGEADAWRRGFAAGMWEAFDGEDARESYRRSAAALGRQARGDLAREMVLASFGPDFPERRHSELDRLLDALPEGERTQLLQEAIASATTAQKDDVLGYIAKSRHSSGPENFGLRLAATLWLTDKQSELAARTSRELAEALERPEIFGSAVKFVLERVALKAGETKVSAELESNKLEEVHEAQLQQERQEQERLRQQVRERNAELASNREESRLEIRQDMLLAVGEVLQSVRRAASVEELAGNAEAGLTLALRAGGAEPLETPGEQVAYDPGKHHLENYHLEKHDLEKHHAEGGLPGSSLVRVVAPGVVYRGGIHGDRVLLKAHVKHEAG
jgi:hypothetical protein